MKPVPEPPTILLECRREGCEWKHRVKSGELANSRARYHAIQVHNDQKAVMMGTF